MHADGRETDASDDDGRLAGGRDEPPQDGVGVADELLARDVGARPDQQLGPEPEGPARTVHEAELDERPEVAIDGRHGHLERGAKLVRADLAPVGDGEEQAQTAREGGVLRGFLGRAVASGRHGGP